MTWHLQNFKNGGLQKIKIRNVCEVTIWNCIFPAGNTAIAASDLINDFIS